MTYILSPTGHLSDGSNDAPKLQLHHSLWSLQKLPMNADKEWTLDERFARVKAAGFTAVECWLTPNTDEEARVVDSLTHHNLRLVLGHRPFHVEQTRATIEQAARLEADFVFAQPADAFMPLTDVATLVREGQKIAADFGLPYFVETHRNNFTENLPQTMALLDAVPDLLLTADLSHFVVVGEFYGWAEEKAIERLRPILSRTAHLHARIGNGEQVQVDVGDGSGQTAQFFVSLWAEAIRYFRTRAGSGDILPFASELGPPRYAITLPDGREFSDRWEQSLVMKRLIEQAWQESAA